jgi:hypothetical protein
MRRHSLGWGRFITQNNDILKCSGEDASRESTRRSVQSDLDIHRRGVLDLRRAVE